MKNKKVFLIISIIILISLPLVVFAHPGGTDSEGGHYDDELGEYHYHEGHEAHDHPDGTCPYGYDVDETKGSSIIKKETTTKDDTHFDYYYDDYSSEITTANESSTKTETSKFNVFTTIYIFFSAISIIIVVVLLIKSKKSIDCYTNKLSRYEKYNRVLKQEYNTLYAITREILRHNSIEQITKVPPDINIELKNGEYTITQKDYEGKYGKYTGYVSASGNNYHCVEGCSGATIPICLFDKNMVGKYTPCCKCNAAFIDEELLKEPNWFLPYCKITQYANTHKIKVKNRKSKS